jgi:hypothetical protein
MMTKSNLICWHRCSGGARGVLAAPRPHVDTHIFILLVIHSSRLFFRVILIFRMFLVVICNSWQIGREVKESWENASGLFILLQLLIENLLSSKVGLGQGILEEEVVGWEALLGNAFGVAANA